MADTIAALLRRRANDHGPGLMFEDQAWTYAEFVAACETRARLLAGLRRPGPFHVGILMDNVAEFPMWLGAAALVGAAAVGINPTRRGTELATDINHTACQLIVTERAHLADLNGLDLDLGVDRIVVVDEPGYTDLLDGHVGVGVGVGGPGDDRAGLQIGPETLFLLLFTSGTSGAPKAVKCSQGRLAAIGERVREMFSLSPADVCYQAMPMFHGNALMYTWAPALTVGAPVALRRRFSASGFLSDVRKFGATTFNYVGKPVSYILATPERPDDADNTLRRAFGNEASSVDVARFSARFGCQVTEGYGSSEGGVSITRTPDTPAEALGVGPEGVLIVNSETGQECPRAVFDASGGLLNSDEAIGEIVNTSAGTSFEGYWDNPEATQARSRGGWYWTGDLGYRDEAGFFYFAGRDYDWLRVDGENFAAAPVERILARFPGVMLAAVYAVADPDGSDQVMAALQMSPGVSFDAPGFEKFLGEQPDLGTKWSPSFVRIVDELPSTATNKVVKRGLRGEAWECGDLMWWRPSGQDSYRVLGRGDVDALNEALRARGRGAVILGKKASDQAPN